MKTFFLPFILCLSLLSVAPFGLKAQVEVCLSLANEHVDSGYYHFDVYLKTSATSTGDLFLGNADFRIFFDSSKFTSPVLSKVASSNTFAPKTPGTGGINTLVTQITYQNNTSVDTQFGNELVINLNGPTPSDQSSFNTSVAKIDTSTLSHRLATFKVSGYKGGAADLSWKLTGSLKTLVFSLADDAASSPAFLSSETSIVTCSSILPVSKLWLQGKALSRSEVQLDWTTVAEINNDHFIVEKSLGEHRFFPIGKVAGSGTTFDPRQYFFLDQTAMAAINYYRLKQVNIDGSFSHSSIIEVHMAQKGPQVEAYPNPAEDKLRLKARGLAEGNLSFALFDGQGRMVRTANWQLDRLEELVINVSDLPQGIYHYISTWEGQRWSGSLVKK